MINCYWIHSLCLGIWQVFVNVCQLFSTSIWIFSIHIHRWRKSKSKITFFFIYFQSLFDRFRNEIRVIRFDGPLKPWELHFDDRNGQLYSNFNARSDIERDLLVTWWRNMQQHVPSVDQRCNQVYSSSFSLSSIWFCSSNSSNPIRIIKQSINRSVNYFSI